jgi:AsmA-like protein
MAVAQVLFRKKHRTRRIVITVFLCLLLIGVHLMFYFWPFRYRQVHPMLESAFRSKVTVSGYHRTYFPHPGFVADHVTFYRHGDTSIPPLITVRRMTVSGNWFSLLFHPHLLRSIQLEDVHIQIPPSGTPAHQKDFEQTGPKSESKITIETIAVDHATLDFLKKGQAPMRFIFAPADVHNVKQGQPFTFSASIAIPKPNGLVKTQGTLGPFTASHYQGTHISGSFDLIHADLRNIDGFSGMAKATGRYEGTLDRLEVTGEASSPNFRVSDDHAVPVNVQYQILVNGPAGDVQVQHSVFRSGDSTITATASITGHPKTTHVDFQTKDGNLMRYLQVIEHGEPETQGRATFQASAEFTNGPEPFLKRLKLNGEISLDHVSFISKQQQTMDAFSARVRKNPPDDPQASSQSNPPEIFAEASSHTHFDDGVAYLPDVVVTIPGAKGKLKGTFNLLNYKVHLTGTAKLQKGLSHTSTGWKSVLLKPLAPFFRHKNAGTVISIAVTGTSQKPNLTQDVLHNK